MDNSSQRSQATTQAQDQNFAEAFRAYVEALWDVQTEAQRRSLDAYWAYAQALLESHGNIDAHTSDAWQAWVQTQQEAQLEAGTRSQEAFRDYIRAQQAAWAQVDAEVLDLASLWRITQRLQTAVWLTWSGQAWPILWVLLSGIGRDYGAQQAQGATVQNDGPRRNPRAKAEGDDS